MNGIEHGEGESPGELGPKLAALGVTLFTVGVDGPDYDLNTVGSWIAWRDKQNG